MPLPIPSYKPVPNVAPQSSVNLSKAYVRYLGFRLQTLISTFAILVIPDSLEYYLLL